MKASALSMGNPHLVLFLNDPARVSVSHIGPALEHDMGPDGTNVEFVQVEGDEIVAGSGSGIGGDDGLRK